MPLIDSGVLLTSRGRPRLLPFTGRDQSGAMLRTSSQQMPASEVKWLHTCLLHELVLVDSCQNLQP